jgi:hypothetical protein
MNKTSQPETPAQAREWDKTNNHYRRLGLCTRCAPQAAYGHADGFSNVKRPCTECLPVVAALPTSEPNGWRSQSRRLGKAFSSAIGSPRGH